MSRTRLSKISMTPQGAWDSTTEYKRLDVVSNAGASWLAKQDNVGITPVEGENWMNLVNITKDSVVDALGYEVQPADKMKLIANFKTTEDATNIVITQDSNGNQFELCGFTFHLRPALTTDEQLGFTWGAFFGRDTTGYYNIPGEFNSARVNTKGECPYVFTGTIKAIGATYEVWSVQGWDNNNDSVYRKPSSFDVSTNYTIKAIKISEWHGRIIPAGSSFLCYGYYR